MRVQHTDSCYELFHFYLRAKNSINGFSCSIYLMCFIFITFNFVCLCQQIDLHTVGRLCYFHCDFQPNKTQPNYKYISFINIFFLNKNLNN